ncbi:Hypothetical_protein [Hexamita inflata]|uniref:Hypothetical_protein n=1 Tax=Hexamita inflata TaxID=28002 RepID=A0AA86NQN6_9EUKA|nr:Hypothetical protein HINF_LOCUS10691 [Hexamita inflata]
MTRMQFNFLFLHLSMEIKIANRQKPIIYTAKHKVAHTQCTAPTITFPNMIVRVHGKKPIRSQHVAPKYMVPVIMRAKILLTGSKRCLMQLTAGISTKKLIIYPNEKKIQPCGFLFFVYDPRCENVLCKIEQSFFFGNIKQQIKQQMKTVPNPNTQCNLQTNG